MKRPSFLFVEYELYGMQKNIVFHCMSQYENWVWALTQLNENDNNYTAFKVDRITEERY